MRFSIRLNNDLSLAEYVSLARTAEQAGFDQFWVSNDLFLRSMHTVFTISAAMCLTGVYFSWCRGSILGVNGQEPRDQE